MNNSIRSVAITLLAVALTGTIAESQPKEPPRSEKLNIQIRYRIRADRDERIRQYRALEKHLADLGFTDARKDDPDRDLDILDPTAERHVGSIPGTKVMDVLRDVRVQNILFAPADFAYPDDPEKHVALKLGLRTGLLGPVQQQLHKQTVEHLASLGFVESLGYDTLGYSLVRGSIPVKNLDLLVKDVRSVPSGWFISETPVNRLPSPLRDNNPIRWAEVVPIRDIIPPFNPAPVLPVQLLYSADLRAALLDSDAKNAPIRVEVAFENPITNIEALRTLVNGRYAGSSLDGTIGNIASIYFANHAQVERFAIEPGVLYMRLPRQASETIAIQPAGKGITPGEAIKAARLDKLHRLGYTGTGVKVVLIGSDFSGAEQLIGNELPKRTRIVDLTIELTPQLVPAKTDPARIGSGTAAAMALAAAAPDAELILTRIDPGCFFHLDTVIKLSRDEMKYTDALQTRLAEIAARRERLENDQRQAIIAYRAAFADLSDTELAVAARKKAKADLDAVMVREKELLAYVERFNTYQKEISTAFVGANLIVNTLVWESGYPLDSLSEFGRRLDRLSAQAPPRIMKRAGDPEALPKAPLIWLQAASNAGATVWGGPFLDSNGDGLMEFIPEGTKLPPDNWSPQLNFLGTRSNTGDVLPEVGAGTKLRFVVQWREPADPRFPENTMPVYPLTLRLMRQVDPSGETRSSDEMAEEARSVSVPNVIHRTGTYLVFEQILEYTVPNEGRYALAIESLEGAQPLLPALRREVEIYPRVVVETRGAAASDPRVVFRSFTNFTAGVGTPGDSLGAITVGTDDKGVQIGGGTGITLREKPDIYGPPALTFNNQRAGGQGIATSFAGGAAVLLVQARATGPNVFLSARIKEGEHLVLPEAWLKIVPPAEKMKP